MSDARPKHKLSDFNFGNWLFTTRIVNNRVRHRLLGCITLIDVSVSDVDLTPYKGEGTVLHLQGGRTVRLLGMRLDRYVKLLQCVDVINHPRLRGGLPGT